MKKLTDFAVHEKICIEKVLAQSLQKERLLALGFTRGAQIEVLRKGPKGNLTLYRVRDTMLALRQEEGELILASALRKDGETR